MQQLNSSILVEKQRIIDPSKSGLIHSLKKIWVGTAGVVRNIVSLIQNFMDAKLKVIIS